MPALRVPVATYRLQFNKDFGFAAARAIVPYLHALGVSDVYASPIFKARKGSAHGYDVTEPQRLNPEFGTDQEFDELVAELKAHGMGLLLDIVPNHMAASPDNPWWTDVLENGISSPYALYFDIDFHPGDPMARENKILLPVLGRPFGTALELQELTLTLDEAGFGVNYYQSRFPLDPRTYDQVLSYRLSDLEAQLGRDHAAYQQLHRVVDASQRLPTRTNTDPQEIKRRLSDEPPLKQMLWQAYNAHPALHTFVDENIRIFNGARGDGRSFDLLERLLDSQAYRLAYWRVASDRAGYRRFFDISDLVSVHPEVPSVFEAMHALALRLVDEGKVTGLRIDHIDGLLDPVGYLLQLQARIAPRPPDTPPEEPPAFYVIAEKILMGDETLPDDWPVYGTTGYDFMNLSNGLMVSPEGLKALEASYARETGILTTFQDMVCEKKQLVIDELFAGEMRALSHRLAYVAQQDRHARDLSPDDLDRALKGVIACFPVYRTYSRGGEMAERDKAYVKAAIAEAQHRSPRGSLAVSRFLGTVLTLDSPPTLTAQQREAWVRFVMRWQQFTGPIMAKGLEDTASYVYNRLISLNEVGSDSRPISISHFHERMAERQRRWPHTMNASSTHDTKRSEDVRARIDILSEMPRAWARRQRAWGRWNCRFKQKIDGVQTPDANEETLLYQTLVGAWPLSRNEVPGFRERLKQYMTKAMREAKTHTSWVDIHAEHEQAVLGFIDSILTESEDNAFLPDFLRFQRMVAYYGSLVSLSQLLLKATCPGLPDFYQGTETWDLSLADPDNRRPVDFDARARFLNWMEGRRNANRVALARETLSRWEDGRVKLLLTSRALAFRREHAALFKDGAYVPLAASGEANEHVVAFLRRRGRECALVAAPRLVTSLCEPGRPPLGRRAWGSAFLRLPPDSPRAWRNAVTGERVRAETEDGVCTVLLGELFSSFPAALLGGEEDTRGAAR